MIAQITGSIVNKGLDSLVVNVAGVGYRVFVLPNVQLADNEKATFHTHQYIREDQLTLYGFLQEDELAMFEMLISVSGIGPKAAMGILTAGSVDTLKKAIAEGRSDILKSVSGVGTKTAERTILELKGKVSEVGDVALPRLMTQEDESAVGALVNLGYKKNEAAQAIADANKEEDGLSVENKIKKALKHLGK